MGCQRCSTLVAPGLTFAYSDENFPSSTLGWLDCEAKRVCRVLIACVDLTNPNALFGTLRISPCRNDPFRPNWE